jgi:hypothetical protein
MISRFIDFLRFVDAVSSGQEPRRFDGRSKARPWNSYRRPARNACIREDDLKFAKVFGEFSEELLSVLRNRNVSAIAVRFPSQFGDRFIQCLLIATCNCDFCAFRDEKAGCGKADATVATGNESPFACELHDSSSMTD